MFWQIVFVTYLCVRGWPIISFFAAVASFRSLIWPHKDATSELTSIQKMCLLVFDPPKPFLYNILAQSPRNKGNITGTASLPQGSLRQTLGVCVCFRESKGQWGQTRTTWCSGIDLTLPSWPWPYTVVIFSLTLYVFYSFQEQGLHSVFFLCKGFSCTKHCLGETHHVSQ